LLFQSLQDFEREPDVASDFFGMCIRYIKLHKSLLFRSQHLPALIKVWSLGIGIEQSNAVETHTEFFNTLVKVLSKDIQTIQDISNPEQVMNSGLDQNEIVSFKPNPNSCYGIFSSLKGRTSFRNTWT